MVMCSYNKLNGDWACENSYLLDSVLKKDWGFRGFVISDWGGTHSITKATPARQRRAGIPVFRRLAEDGGGEWEVPLAQLDDRMVHAPSCTPNSQQAGIVDDPPRGRVVDPFCRRRPGAANRRAGFGAAEEASAASFLCAPRPSNPSRRSRMPIPACSPAVALRKWMRRAPSGAALVARRSGSLRHRSPPFRPKRPTPRWNSTMAPTRLPPRPCSPSSSSTTQRRPRCAHVDAAR